MSIKDELREKLRKNKSNHNSELEIEAKIMIEEFLIPKFREISSKQPENEYLQIKFHNNMGGFYYTSNINTWEKRIKSPYSFEVVSMAAKMACKFDIEVFEHDDGSGGDTYDFILDLR